MPTHIFVIKNNQRRHLMKFKSKVDWWLNLIFAGFVIINIWAIISFVLGSGSIVMVIIFSPLAILLIIPIWLNTYYLVGDNELLIKCGLLNYAKIDYNLIASITGTRSLLSSPALSLDRLEIRYKAKNGKFYNTIIISPKDKQELINQLTAKNKGIKVTEGKNIKPNKIVGIIMGGVAVAIAISVAVVIIAAEQEPVVTIHGNSIQISGIYGTSVGFYNIADINLLDQSMREIGSGRRTNGYNGGAWRGHFTAGLLFVRPNSSPTIQIERHHGSDIFISLRDGENTEQLFNNLLAAGIIH